MSEFFSEISTNLRVLFKGFLEIQPKVALTVGISTLIGAGLAYGSVKWLNSIYSDRPPKKLVRAISP